MSVELSVSSFPRKTSVCAYAIKASRRYKSMWIHVQLCIRVLVYPCWCKILNFPRKYSLSALYQSMTRAGSIPVLMLDIEFPKSQRVNVNVNVNV